MEKLILVFYLDCREGVTQEDFENAKRSLIVGQPTNTMYIFMQIQGENRVECINPQFVTDPGIVGNMITRIQRMEEQLTDSMENYLIVDKPREFKINKKKKT